MTRNARDRGSKRGSSSAPWAKVKFDRQIVAIAKVAGATTIYSDDLNLMTVAKAANIDVVSLAELPLPPEDAQLKLELAGVAESNTAPANEVDDDNQPTS